LFVISSLEAGGAQRALSNVVTNLPDDLEIDILLSHTEKVTYPYKGNIIGLSIKEPDNRKNLLYQARVLCRRFFALRKLKKHKNYTACISFLTSANIVNVLTGNKYCKTIVSIRNDSRHSGFSGIERFFNRIECLLNKRADFAVSVSESIREYMIRDLGFSPHKVKTIYNGYSKENYITDESTTIERTAGNNFTFITTGRLSKQKGQWHLIRAFSRLVEKHPDCRLCILGEGPLRTYLEELVKQLNLERHVSLPGFVENTFDYYRQSSAFVLTSRWEGFPNVMIEAMMCGLPVISCDCYTGPREILAPDTDNSYQVKCEIECARYGIITPPMSGAFLPAHSALEKEEMLLFEAMQKIITKDNLREKYCNMSIMRSEHFLIDNCVKQWLELLKSSI